MLCDECDKSVEQDASQNLSCNIKQRNTSAASSVGALTPFFLKIFIFCFCFFSELCWGKAMVTYTMPQQRKKEESERL